MDREKQIEEMAKVMCGGCPDNNECMRCLCATWYNAEALYKAGYRKEDDIAKEIFEKLYANIKFNRHTVSVWKNNLIEAAKEYGISL